MRIPYDIMRDGMFGVNQAAINLAAAQRQVSSGRRINRVGDDPLGSQQAVSEHAGLAAVDAYSRSRDAAAARLGMLEASLSSIGDKLSAVLVAATGARGTAVPQSARDAAAASVRGLRDSLAAAINGTFNGAYMFSGTASRTPAYALVGGAWTYQGTSDTMQVEIEPGRQVSVTIDGQSIAQGTDATDVLTVLDQLATAIEAGDDAGIGTGVAGVERALDRTLRAHGSLGADERGLDDATLRLSSLRVARETRRSQLEDANIAEAISRLSQADTTYRAALSAVGAVERASLLDYLR